MGHEDPRFLSDREPPAEQNKMKALGKNTPRREALFLPYTGLPVIKQAQHEMKKCQTAPQSGGQIGRTVIY